MEEQSLIQTIFDSENTGLELCYDEELEWAQRGL